MSSGDVWSGGVLAAVGSYVVAQSAQWDYLTVDGPGPGFFPIWYGIALVVLSLALIVHASRKPRLQHGGSGTQWRRVSRALGVWAAFAASAALLPVLGFLLSFALLTVFIVCAMYGRPLMTGVAAGVLGAAAFYLIFPFALEVVLPIGKLGF